ncbi:MAG: ABC-F family ATP-binding cassette domain-containing protein [Candidatus Altimarinota bacterium]
MNHINIHLDSYEVDGETIIAHIHTIINATDRVAIVGPNGVGKSTFLKIVSGEISDYQGSIENIGNISLGYLEQIQFLDETKKVRDELKDAFFELRQLEQIIKVEEEKLSENGEYEKYTEAIEQYKYLGGYTYENEVERVSRGIGIFHLLERRLNEVSGGERTKIALAKTLLSRPDFLLLDEPTNFIDLSSVEWLEKYLQESWKGGYMIVSHDREFLDETVTIVIEILGPKGIIITHGNYTDSVSEKREKIKREKKAYDEQTMLIESEKELINRFRAGSRAGFAKSRERALEKIEVLQKPEERRDIKFQFSLPKERAPESLIRIEEAFIGRQDPLFFIREASLVPGERIGIVGENGVGKSTLIKTLLGTLPDEERENFTKKYHLIPVLEGFLTIAKNIRVGYYSQMHETLDTSKTIEENFIIHGLPYSKERIGGILVAFGFGYHDSNRKVEELSGGERSRLLFAFICELPYHLLILDEPTNHLDYETREMLEGALKNFGGSVLFISHDRYFVNKLANKLWIIEDGELILSYGNYEDYRYKKEKGISLDMSLFDAEGEMNLVLEEKLGASEARRIKEKFARKKKRV